MSLSATLFGRDSAIFKATNILGLGIPGWLDKKFGPPETEGPRLSDLTVQTSTYGSEIPRYYGTCAGAGNLLALENNKLKETVRKKKSGGKGGGGASEPTTTYSYSATFLLGLCEGPIAGIRRMWCGDKLIYNAGSDDLETIIASNKAAKGWRLYLGTDDQMPDPRYEAEHGVGNVSAFRGLAYIAFYDFQLADYSNTLQAAQFKVEIVNSVTGAPQLAEQRQPPIDVLTYGGANARNAQGFSTYSLVRGVNTAQIVDYGSFREEKPLGYDASGLFPTPQAVTCSLTDAEHCIRSAPPGSAAPFYVGVGTESGQEIFACGDYSPEVVAEKSSQVYAVGQNISAAYVLMRLDDPDVADLSYSPPTSVRGVVATGSGCITFRATPSLEIEVYDDQLASQKVFTVPAGSVDPFSPATYEDGKLYICTAIPSMTSSTFTVLEVDIETEAYSYYTVSTTITWTNTLTFALRFSLRYVDGVFFLNGRASTTLRHVSMIRDVAGQLPAQLTDVIESEIEKSSLIGAADIDLSLMSGSVRGYRVSGGSIRSALEPLSTAFQFDIRAHGYQLQFVPRGQASVVTIPWEELGAASGDSQDEILPQSREMDPQLPARTTISYLDAAREYSISEQYSERLNTEAVNRVERELAIVFTGDEAAGIAEMLNNGPWIERTGLSFSLPPPYQYLEAADVVTIQAPNATYEVRITEPEYTQDGRLECKAVTSSAALYTPNATGGEGVPPTGIIPLAGPSLFIPLDIPTVDETIQNAVGFVGVATGYSPAWPGALVVRSADDGQTWSDLQAYTGQATVGIVSNTLPASSSTLIDQRSLEVSMISGELESLTRDQMLAGANYAAYGADGRWEIVRFQNADLQGDGSYLISGFVRGEKGTEWATGLHAVGDYFVLLDDPDNAFIGAPVESIGLSRLYRGVTSGSSLDDAADVPFAYQGVNLECLSPVYAKGSRDGSSNFTGTFTRRSRLSSSWWTTGVVAPVGETSESYEVDVMSGTTVKRTISVSSPSFSYSAADQTTDFGSAQSSITFRIYQLSEVVGRGYPLEVAL